MTDNTNFNDAIKGMRTALDSARANDIYRNSRSGQGVSGADILSSTEVGKEIIHSNDDFRKMYAFDWIIGKSIDARVDDITDTWRSYQGLKPSQLEKVLILEKELKLKARLDRAMKDAAVFGGSAVLMVTSNDHKDTAKPVKSGAKLEYLHAIPRDKITIVSDSIDNDPFSPTYRQPTLYKIGESFVHESRLLRFDGLRTNDDFTKWGKSKIKRLYFPAVQAQTILNVLTNLVSDSVIDIFHVDDYWAKLARCAKTKSAQDDIDTLIQKIKHDKGVYKALVMDKNADFSRLQTNFAGFPDILRDALITCAAAADIPVTRMLGQSPAGFNSTGESDTKNYYQSLSSERNKQLSDNLFKLDKLFIKTALNTVPKSYSFEFNDFGELTEIERENLASKRMKRHIDALNAGIPEHTVLEEIAKEGDYNISQEYIAALSELEDDAEA